MNTIAIQLLVKYRMTKEVLASVFAAPFLILLESGRIDHSESDRNSQFELNRNSQCTLAN